MRETIAAGLAASQGLLTSVNRISATSQFCHSLPAVLLSPNIGDSTPHGQANQRVMRGIISWMKEHSEIRGR